MSYSLSSVWVHLVQFAKFPMLRFSKGHRSRNFHPITATGFEILVLREYRLLLFGDLPKIKNEQDHMGLEDSKRYPSYSFHPISAELYEGISYHGGMRVFTFLVNRKSF